MPDEIPPFVAEELREHLAPIAAEVVARLELEHSDLEPWLAADLLPGLALAGRQVANLATPGGEITCHELMVEYGRRLHRDGRDPVRTLTVIRRASALWWRSVSTLPAFASLPAASIAVLAEFQPRIVAALGESLSAGYSDERERTSSTAVGARESLLDLVLAGAPREHLRERERDAGWPVPDRIVVAAARRQTVAEGPVPSRVLHGRSGGDAVMVVADAPEATAWLARCRRPLGLRGPIVCSHPVATAAAPSALERVSRVLAHVGGDAGDDVVEAEDFLLELVLATGSLPARSLVARRLAPFRELDPAVRDRLLSTLGAWLDRPDRPQAIADQLFVHVQTVRYRVKQLRKLLGPDLDEPTARLELALAVRLARQMPARTPPATGGAHRTDSSAANGDRS